MVNYGLVGAGYFGADLARVMNQQEDAKVTVVYDPDNGTKIANELGCDAASSLDELVEREDISCVIVATPNYLHKEPVIKAAQHGKNVFCEKPIALCYEDCDAMVKACEENHVVFGKVLYCHSARNGWEDVQTSVSWKKIREKSGGHLYHHIHELDCVQFIMGGMPETVYMNADNVAHRGEEFGDEDDMIFINMKFSDNRYAVLEWGSAFHWPEHYLLIQGTKGAIRLDMFDAGVTLKVDGREVHSLLHENEEEDANRTAIYHGTEMDGAIQYGNPDKIPPLWLHGLIVKEMKYLNDIMHGMKPTKEFEKLLNGVAAREAIATADACTKSNREGRVVKMEEIL